MRDNGYRYWLKKVDLKLSRCGNVYSIYAKELDDEDFDITKWDPDRGPIGMKMNKWHLDNLITDIRAQMNEILSEKV